MHCDYSSKIPLSSSRGFITYENYIVRFQIRFFLEPLLTSCNFMQIFLGKSAPKLVSQVLHMSPSTSSIAVVLCRQCRREFNCWMQFEKVVRGKCFMTVDVKCNRNKSREFIIDSASSKNVCSWSSEKH